MKHRGPTPVAANPRPRGWPSWGGLKSWVVAFAIAIGLWLFVNTGERTSERTLRVRLEPENLPPGLVITNPGAEQVELQVSGPGVILAGIDPRRVYTPLDLSGVRPGVATFSLNPKMFPLPRKVEVLRLTPAQVSLQVDRIVSRTLPVRVARRGEAPAGYSVAELDVAPEKIEARGPSSKLEGLRSLDTVALELGDLPPGESRAKLAVVGVDDAVQLAPPEVEVRVALERLVTDRTFLDVEVQVRGSSGGWRVEPPRIDLVVRGPRRAVEPLELGRGSVYVEPGGLALPGPHRVRPKVDLPAGVEIVRQEPKAVLIEAVGASRPRGEKRAPARKVEARRG